MRTKSRYSEVFLFKACLGISLVHRLFTQKTVNNNVSKYSWKIAPTPVTLSTHHPLLSFAEDCASKSWFQSLHLRQWRWRCNKKIAIFSSTDSSELQRSVPSVTFSPLHCPTLTSPEYQNSFKLFKIPDFQMADRILTLPSFRTS